MEDHEKNIIFLDTSIFEAENFFLGRKLKNLLELSRDQYIELKITDIVYREVINRLLSNIDKAATAFRKAHILLDNQAKILKNLDDFSSFYPFPEFNRDDLFQRLKIKFDNIISDYNIEVLKSDISDIDKVFEDYFSSRPPFSKEKKKNEFPDAFSFSTIEKWADDQYNECFFITNDKDFEGMNSNVVSLKYNLPQIIDFINREIEDKEIEFLEEIYENSKIEIEIDLEKDFIDELQDAISDQILMDPKYRDSSVERPFDIEVSIAYAAIAEISKDSSASFEVESNITFMVEFEYTDIEESHYGSEGPLFFDEKRVSKINQYEANVISIANFNYDFKEKNGFYLGTHEFEIRSISKV